MPTSIELLAEVESDASREAAAAMVELAVEYLAATRDRARPVSTAHTPRELAMRFADPIPRVGRPLAEVVDRLRKDVLADANHLYHPRYVGHQVSAPLPVAIWAESVIAALNNSVAVWEMSPTATMMEHAVVRWMCGEIGWDCSTPHMPGGTFTSGGTEATFTALLAARAAALPNAWEDGVGAAPPALVCGEHAHYAVTRAAGELGIGMRSVVTVPSVDCRMDVRALRGALERLAGEGRTVMAVVATAGSTATGSFDDLDAIGTLCTQRGVWLHVDGAHGAAALLSPQRRHLVSGLTHARSVAWDPHKMMLLPLQAGLLFVRDARDLEAAFAQRAPYLFHSADGEPVVDQGVRSFLCSRRADVIKLWVALQRHGADGVGLLFDHLCDVARAMHAAIQERVDFVAMHVPTCNILCFRWVGDRTKSDIELDRINLELRERYNRSGEGWITTTVLGGRRVLRVTIMNVRTTADDATEVLEGIARTARALIA